MKPVYVRIGFAHERKIGAAANWAEAKALAEAWEGGRLGTVSVASQAWLFGRKRREVYVCRTAPAPDKNRSTP